MTAARPRAHNRARTLNLVACIPHELQVRRGFARRREGFGFWCVAPNMVRASGRSAVSHLHVVATQPATTPGDAPLIERAVEIEVLDGAVRCLAEGDGGVVVLDAPAGLGKTALLEHAALTAADAGCLVRRAAPGPLERHFPFGVVRALLEAPLREASDERARAAARRRRGAGRLAAARRDRPQWGLDDARRPRRAVAVRRARRAAPARAGDRRRPVGRPLLAGGARLPGAAYRRPAAAHRRRRAASTTRARRRTC